MTPDLLEKYAAPVPRYTSYPTAPNFIADIGADQYRDWLGRLPGDRPISLYLHVPFCDTLCWYCGCATKQTRRYDPIAQYVEPLLSEINTVGGLMSARPTVSHIHWGGGSPNTLRAGDIAKLSAALRGSFKIMADVEFAVEIDPRRLDDDVVVAFAAAGVTRVSFGVQDFAQKVQDAINRQQSFEMSKHAIDAFRREGVTSVNLDLVYGLPYQTMDSIDKTLDLTLQLEPDRIAVFGYAHLPKRIVHQRMIPDEALPGTQERFALANKVAERLLEAGFQRVGLDHFARPHDSMASGTVSRNFQGYTTDDAETLIGLGASAIGQLPQGYVQNAVPVGDYARRINETGLATARGRRLSRDDQARALVIEQLMCELRFPAKQLTERFPDLAATLEDEARAVIADDQDGLIEREPDGEGFIITEKGRPFVRTICARFDAYLEGSSARHSAGV